MKRTTFTKKLCNVIEKSLDQCVSIRINEFLRERYKKLLNNELKAVDSEMQSRVLLLIEHQRQFIEGWKKAVKAGKHYSDEEYKQIKKIAPDCKNELSNDGYEFAKINIQNQNEVNKVWIELAKSKVWDSKCELWPFTTPGGIYIDSDTKESHNIGVMSVKMPEFKQKLNVKTIVKTITDMLEEDKANNPNNKIVFCPYEIRINTGNNCRYAICRYGKRAI